MEIFNDTAFILATKPLSERDVMVDILCATHGKIRGVVKYGATSKQRGVVQLGNCVQVQGEARLATHMPRLALELLIPYCALFMRDALMCALSHTASALCAAHLPEHEQNQRIYEGMLHLYECMYQQPWQAYMAEYVRFELGLLQECGYGLQLTHCVATGSGEELSYISPKSGQAVSHAAGAPYRDKLFPYPPFLYDREYIPCAKELLAALQMTGYFIEQRMGAERILPWVAVRARLIAQLERVKEQNNERIFSE